MAVKRGFLLLAFACCVLSEGEPLFEPCNTDDIGCLSKATETFLEKTASNGIPKYDIKPTDPLIIPELDVTVDEDMGLIFKFKNVNITGLKHQQISDFKMDVDKRSVVLKTKAVVNIFADLSITFTKKDKKFDGLYTASTTALGTSLYGYSLTKRGDNEYFDLGPETNTCEIIGEPNVTISSDLQKTLENDTDAKAMKPEYEANKVALRKKTLCKIIETAYTTVIHNIRASAKLLPKNAFFINI